MSIAPLEAPRTATVSPISAAARVSAVAASSHVDAASASAPASAPAPRVRAVPAGTEARGFVLYVGIDEDKAAADGTDLGEIVEQLKALAAQLAPSSETYAAVALAPRGVGGRDVEVVRLALQDPAALAKHRQAPEADEDRARDGVVVDLSRKRVLLDNNPANLTYKEFELLQYLVLREGRTIERAELISALWSAGDEEAPNERTIDVHVRRLRSKLGDYEDIVRTVRGVGYRFDRHADVSVRHTSTPSPDLF
ncbi:winged helix-turn-helix domain-containing protein [Herbiconiux sp. KACC 21604]|uniref:winged helix-turn-helix domain-containing protein n=1 Tax=unclassified Herbiconiux TaxID=2618217 RepID=UPI001491DE60|nr:winged helix-turn-helix domain-containing protein [Herbiconiux sp. SALV-R1]QJU52201.1 winged helix-turn-helix transcriptional regulator [Herbiconiux sp. SALV-R1]WPO87044.1 winged helix-turn-helix domain-containing protein [Herbiconiux sp. KACC 21604]